jgi:hypothetical protein
MDYCPHASLAVAGSADLWSMVEAVERARLSESDWSDLALEFLELRTRAGQDVRAKSMSEAAAWVSRQPMRSISSVFVRWTQNGRAAGPGMKRIAMRLGSEPTLWVGATDESAAVGMLEVLRRTLEDRPLEHRQGVGVASGPPLDLPSAAVVLGSGEPTGRDRRQRGPTLRRWASSLSHPWVVALVPTTIAAIAAAWIVKHLGWG